MSENNDPTQIKGIKKIFAHRIVFLLHLFVFVFVNLLLILIWGVTDAEKFWPIGSIFGWGIGILLHTVTYLMYNEKLEILSKLKREGNFFKISIVYHGTLFASIILLLLMIDLMVLPFTGIFFYPMIIWGILVIIHGIGSFKVVDKKVMNLWVLLMHTALFIILTIFQYTLWSTSLTQGENIDQIMNTLSWGIILLVHALGVGLTYFTKLQSKFKVLIFHVTAYVLLSVYLIIRNNIADNLFKMYWPYPVILLGIWIIVLIGMTLSWDTLMKRALKRVKNKFGQELEEISLIVKAKRLIHWQGSFIAHILIYIAGLLMFKYAPDNVYSLQEENTFLIVVLSWLIGLGIHGMSVFIVWKPIRNNLTKSIIIHLIIFILTGILLVAINLLYNPEVLWSIIALGGWSVGLGLHIMVKVLKKK